MTPDLPAGRQLYWLAPLVAGCVAAATLMLDRENGIPAWIELRGRIADAGALVQDLGTSREELRAEIEALRADPFALEARAREQLGMVRDGELVLRFREPE